MKKRNFLYKVTMVKAWNFWNNLREKYLMIHTCIGNLKKGIRKAKFKKKFWKLLKIWHLIVLTKVLFSSTKTDAFYMVGIIN